MKKLSLILLMIPIGFPVFSQNPGDTLFAGIQVHTVNFIFSQPDYWDSLTIYYEAGNEQYIPATVIFDGITYDSVGVRFKGHSSYTHPNNKKPFRLSFDQYHADQRIDGLKGLHLNNGWGDPTFMREKMHLDFCRDAGIAAPRGNYARVSINDSLWGLYSLVEHVDKKFLFTHFGDQTGDLFKAVDEFGGSTYVSDFKWYGNQDTAYALRYEMKTDGSLTAWPNLIRLLDTLNNGKTPATSIPANIDAVAFYKALASNIIFGNLDSYINSGRNFYFYFHPVTGKMEWITWDTGLSFGGYNGGVSSPETMSVSYIVSSANRPLVGKIYNTPALKSRYLRTLCCLFEDYFIPAGLFSHIDSVANVIRPYVIEDPRKMYTYPQFETNINSDITVGGTRKPGLKSFITARYSSIQSQLNSLGITCTQFISPGDLVINEFMAVNDSITDPAGETDDWIELYNNTTDTLHLGGLFLSDDPLQPAKWQFPSDAKINPNDYLIIWADEDTAQEGIHVNFQLSSSGGFIQLSNTDSALLDSVSFGAQTLNHTMARVPNGTGYFFPCYPTFSSINSSGSLITNPLLETVILPRYIEGLNGTNANRIPFAYRARISGLLPNATYRYINQVVISSDAVTTNGSGNCIFANLSGNFTRTSGPSLATAGNYGTFTTDESGTAENWFITEPTGNARFVPGKFVFMRIILNDGGSGTSAAIRLTTQDSVRVVQLLAAAGDTMAGTGLRCTTSASPKDFVLVYDHTAGNGRPVSGTFIESDGTDNSTGNNYAAFYSGYVNGTDGAFGMVLPNNLPDGIRRVERRALADGQLIVTATDDDGVWPSGANTVNPSGGTTEIVLAGSDVNQLTGITSDVRTPKPFELMQNFPNPFNPSTVIRFNIPQNGRVKLEVFNLLGQKVKTLVNGWLTAGYHEVVFDASALASGIYFYRLSTNNNKQTRRMILLK